MGLFDLFRAAGLRPTWTYTVAGTLWRVILAPPGHIVGEERDTTAKVATFFALDLKTGHVRWSGRRFHDDWWVGVSAAHRNVLLLHGFATPNMPGHRGIVAADLSSGDVLWSDPASSLLEFREDKVLLSRETPDGHVVEERGLRTGARTAATPRDDGSEHASAENGSWNILVPQLLHTAEEDPRLQHLLGSSFPSESDLWPKEIIEHPRAMVLLTHEPGSSHPAPGGLTARLRVVDPGSGTLLHEEIVLMGMHAPVRNTFSVVEDTLLYIKDGRSLRAIPL